MLAILVFAGLAACGFGAQLDPTQLYDFVDSVLEEADHLVSVNRQLPGYQFSLGPFFDVSISWGRITLRGPTELKRDGAVEGHQASVAAQASAVVSLGQLDYQVHNLQVTFFGYRYSTDVLLTLQNAKSLVNIQVFRNHLASCQVFVSVEPPSGVHLIHLGSKDGPTKLFVGALEYALSFFWRYLPSPFVGTPIFFSDVLTRQLERELTISTRRISC